MEGWPVPTLMIAGGAALGILLAITAKFIAAGGCTACGRRRRGNGSRPPWPTSPGQLVVEPVEVEVSRLKSFNAALKAAAAA